VLCGLASSRKMKKEGPKAGCCGNLIDVANPKRRLVGCFSIASGHSFPSCFNLSSNGGHVFPLSSRCFSIALGNVSLRASTYLLMGGMVSLYFPSDFQLLWVTVPLRASTYLVMAGMGSLYFHEFFNCFGERPKPNSKPPKIRGVINPVFLFSKWLGWSMFWLRFGFLGF